MRSFSTFVSVLAFVAAAVAQDPNFDSINTPTKDEKVPAGKPFNITWSLISSTTPTGPVTITLIGGTSPQTLTTIGVIGHANNQDLMFEWDVASTLGAQPVYGLMISLDADTADFQFSQPFQIVGGAVTSSMTSTMASTSTMMSSMMSTTTPTTMTTMSSTSMSTMSSSMTTSMPTNGTATMSPTASANKTTTTAKASPTSGASLNALPALGALAMAVAGSMVMHWGL